MAPRSGENGAPAPFSYILSRCWDNRLYTFLLAFLLACAWTCKSLYQATKGATPTSTNDTRACCAWRDRKGEIFLVSVQRARTVTRRAEIAFGESLLEYESIVQRGKESKTSGESANVT